MLYHLQSRALQPHQVHGSVDLSKYPSASSSYLKVSMIPQVSISSCREAAVTSILLVNAAVFDCMFVYSWGSLTSSASSSSRPLVDSSINRKKVMIVKKVGHRQPLL